MFLSERKGHWLKWFLNEINTVYFCFLLVIFFLLLHFPSPPPLNRLSSFSSAIFLPMISWAYSPTSSSSSSSSSHFLYFFLKFHKLYFWPFSCLATPSSASFSQYTQYPSCAHVQTKCHLSSLSYILTLNPVHPCHSHWKSKLSCLWHHLLSSRTMIWCPSLHRITIWLLTLSLRSDNMFLVRMLFDMRFL